MRRWSSSRASGGVCSNDCTQEKMRSGRRVRSPACPMREGERPCDAGGRMRLHLVDGTFELFRAHYSKRPDRRFKATAGLLQSLLALLADPGEAVTHVAI